MRSQNDLPPHAHEAKYSSIARSLQEKYGHLIGGGALVKALAYPNSSAFRQAHSRGTVPVPVFDIPNRRGKFAYTVDVATWLASFARDKKRGDK
ncbi:hypothetical protein [Noviherbaspirillum agri]